MCLQSKVGERGHRKISRNNRGQQRGNQEGRHTKGQQRLRLLEAHELGASHKCWLLYLFELRHLGAGIDLLWLRGSDDETLWAVFGHTEISKI
jgi:hypothetical protein